MRTTLKRGTGRVDGNGHGTIPLTALTPVNRYRARRRSPLRLVGKILLWALAVLFIAAGAAAGGVWLYVTEHIHAVQAHSPELIAAQEGLAIPNPHQPTVALVIGYDRRTHGVDASQDSRSDTVMLLRADPNKHTISMLSFPRDLIVDIPGCRDTGPFRGRINEAYTYCGYKGTLNTVKQLTHIPINYIVTVNFEGFMKIVDEVDGVYMDVDHRYLNDNSSGGPTYATIDLHPGYQRLGGRDALDFVRFRHTDSDLEVGVGGGKEIDFDVLYSYAKLAYGLPSGNFQQIQIEGITGYAELEVAQTSIDNAVDAFLNPDAGAADRAANAALGTKPKREAGPPPSEVSIEVLNGNGVAGAADDAAYRLSSRGYEVVNGGNADNFKYFQSTILYDPADPDGRAAGQALADLFGDAELKAAPAGTQLATTLRVIVGQTFQGTLSPGPVDETPEHEPPAVTTDTEAGAYVRAARKKLDFDLMVPTVREQNSSLDSVEPARAYRIGDHGAFRLTYTTGANEYWGVQEVGWEDPPILDGPSVTRTIKGRQYALYFDRAKLHMIAFRQNGASYWVVNTLLNRLSNETMLAIARGLRPVSGQ
jgi:LCP family protein required for cell wall assembly